ncbi:MAG: permease prefix domain 2-containing transporter, partial [Bacteroidota bacterium]
MSTPQPPTWLVACLRWFCAEELLEEIEGDLLEAYCYRYRERGRLYADHAYLRDVLTFFRPYAFERYSRAKQFLPMFSNHFKIALRNLWHRKYFTTLNALGLVLSLSSVLLIVIYLRHEYTYDQHLAAAERVYRLENGYRDQQYTCMAFPEYFNSTPSVQLTLPQHLTAYAEVETVCQFVTTNSAISAGRPFYAKINDDQFILKNALVTNTPVAFQQVFAPDYLLGTSNEFSQQRNGLAITESTAEKWFGRKWPSRLIKGETVVVEDSTYVITGVVTDPPTNSHVGYEALVHQAKIPSWGAYTYVQLTPGASPEQVWQRLNAEVDLFYPGYTEDELSRGIAARALTDIHFTKDVLYEPTPAGNSTYLRMLGWAALLILLVFWTNYANLSTAMYADRQRELGVRRVLGAREQDISRQIVVEALALAVFCAPLVLLTTTLVLPYFGELMEVALTRALIFSGEILMILSLLLLTTALLSSWYPAWRYGQRPLLVLLGQQWQRLLGHRRLHFRNVLLTLQFFLVVGLLSLTAFIYQQMRLIQTTDLGFEQQGVLYFSVPGAEQYQALRTRLNAIPGVLSTGANAVPGAEMFNQLTYQMEGSETTFADATQHYLDWGSLQTLG